MALQALGSLQLTSVSCFSICAFVSHHDHNTTATLLPGLQPSCTNRRWVARPRRNFVKRLFSPASERKLNAANAWRGHVKLKFGKGPSADALPT